jgi:hypothetical protein
MVHAVALAAVGVEVGLAVMVVQVMPLLLLVKVL